MRINSKKTRIITKWSRSKKVKNIQALVRFANFYRNLIENFFKITHSLNELLKKERQWEWEINQEETFQKLKKKFVEKLILKIFNDDKSIIIKVNTLNYVMSACLTQKNKSITYFFKIFQSAKINYNVSDKKLLTVISILQNWKVHLKKATYKIRILSNHNNFIKFITTKELNRRQVK